MRRLLKEDRDDGGSQVLREVCSILLIASLAATPAHAEIREIEIPPSREQGLDMILVDEDAAPPEPELARHLPQVEDISWSGAPIDLMMPIHHLYTDLRRQLSRYRTAWSGLPQVRVPTA